MATILITGASSGFGAMTAEALARDGHRVFASMRDPAAHGGAPAARVASLAAEDLAIETVSLDVTDEASVTAAVQTVLDCAGGIDVLIHNAGHMVFGPTEAFTADQLADLYNINVLGTQRVNRAALPHMRDVGDGLVVWIGSSSTRGGTPPFFAPYFAAKAGMDALAQSYALELSRFGIETSIVVPGAFTGGTQHFAHAGAPADTARADAWRVGPYEGVAEHALSRLAALEPSDADPSAVAREIVRIVALPKGHRPFRSHIDPSQDGAEIVNGVADRVRAQLLERIGLADLLRPQP
ncbi:SDR family oxidoreductase [Rhodospirillaceae bacterium KN72]|uniref:SDR family oxidoreductase n=1 Tax=Pacificispira spongiicola TaxID=2729598 RepID=A0A7Y0E0I0_9PROT|nr:SDR family oxidoreductase [Pacificispira spongiicola]NMM44997.1 SDR family oxidoreductase [Pacificispira spongiicola]